MLLSVPERRASLAASSMPAVWDAASEMRGAADVGAGAAGGGVSLPPKRSPIKDIKQKPIESCPGFVYKFGTWQLPLVRIKLFGPDQICDRLRLAVFGHDIATDERMRRFSFGAIFG